MKLVALVSGGRDSCFAMMRCVDYGHEIVALVNLMPLDDSIDELDSYMYQTVNGFSGCVFRGFASFEEAHKSLEEYNAMQKKKLEIELIKEMKKLNIYWDDD